VRSIHFAFAVPAVVAAVVIGIVLSNSGVAPLPAIGPDVEPLCADVMRRGPADLVQVAWDYPTRSHGQDAVPVTLGSLRSHGGQLVRVAGVLHVEFEWVALYPSLSAMTELHDPRSPARQQAPWVHLGLLWPNEPYWRTRGPDISDRCAVVVGIHNVLEDGHMGMFVGEITALRLEVWSTPHRPHPDLPSTPLILWPPPAR
jgi:hypothetical protein